MKVGSRVERVTCRIHLLHIAAWRKISSTASWLQTNGILETWIFSKAVDWRARQPRCLSHTQTVSILCIITSRHLLSSAALSVRIANRHEQMHNWEKYRNNHNIMFRSTQLGCSALSSQMKIPQQTIPSSWTSCKVEPHVAPVSM